MLYDTGTSRSCISAALYKSLDQAPPLTPMDFLKVQGANGNDLQPLGVIQGTITLGCTDITHQFIVLNSIQTPLILGIDFQKKHGCSSSWTQDGQMQIKWGNAVTINSVATSEEHPIVYAPANICVPPKGVAVLLTTIRGLTIEATESLYKTEPIKGFNKQFPNLLIVPTAYHLAPGRNDTPIICTNKGATAQIIPKGTAMAELHYVDPEKYELHETIMGPFKEVKLNTVETRPSHSHEKDR